MDNLKNVEKLQSSPVPFVSDQDHSNNVNTFKKSLKYGIAFAVGTLAINANAAMPDVDVTDIIAYIGLLVAAVATVASASLMIHLAAKGIKALRTAF